MTGGLGKQAGGGGGFSCQQGNRGGLSDKWGCWSKDLKEVRMPVTGLNGRQHRQCKGPEAGLRLECGSQEVSVAGAE